MFYSEPDDILYIKNRKVGGTSLEICLSQVFSPTIVTPILESVDLHKPQNYRGPCIPKDWSDFVITRRTLSEMVRDALKWRRFNSHSSALTVKSRLGKKRWDQCFKFAVERNPWDKTLSHFFHLFKLGKTTGIDDYFARCTLCSDYWRYSHKNSVILDAVFDYEDAVDQFIKEVHLAKEQEIQLLNLYSELKIKSFSRRSSKYGDQFEFNRAQDDLIKKAFSREIEYMEYKGPFDG